MVRNRTGLAPWSLSREAGIESATVDGTIEIPQYVQPTLSTGFVDEKGNWKGTKSSDKDFFAFQLDSAIANGALIITPHVNQDGTWPLDMTGFSDVILAIKPSSGGNYAIQSIMGPNTVRFANLEPIDSGTALEVLYAGNNGFNPGVDDGAESLTADVWNLFYVQDRLRNQKVLQFKITNNSGGSSNIETAFMRLV